MLIMAGAGYFVFLRSVEGGEHVTVPNLVGMPVSEAYSVLAERGLELGRANTRYSENAPQDYVIAQQPSAGRVVRTGRKVFPTLSIGPDRIPAPGIIGKRQEEAEAELTEAGGFQLGSVARVAHPQSEGLILAQDPPAGRPIPHTTPINILISSGAGGVSEMPEFVGMQADAASGLLESLGLDARTIYVQEPEYDEGVVVAQTPAPGTLIRGDGEVELRVNADERPERTSSYEAVLTYVIPAGVEDALIRVDAVAGDGGVSVIYPLPRDYVNGRPRRWDAGQRFVGRTELDEEMTFILYMNGRKMRSYRFEGDPSPVIQNFD